MVFHAEVNKNKPLDSFKVVNLAFWFLLWIIQRLSRIIQSLIFYQFPLNLLFLCLFLIFVSLPHFQILVMLWFKNTVLILTHSSLVLSQIPLHNFLFIAQNSQALRFLLLLNHPPQFLQQITIIFLLQFLTPLNLLIQNLLVRLLKHLIFHPFHLSLAGTFFSLLLKPVSQLFLKTRCLILPPYLKFLNYCSNLMQ